MTILDKTKIGNSVQVNLEKSRDRLTKDIVDALKISAVAKISDFKITDGKGIGVVLLLSNGKEQWFFEDEIDLLDENGNLLKNIIHTKEENSLTFDILNRLKYENKNKITDLLNPINFSYNVSIFVKEINFIFKEPLLFPIR